MGPNSWLGRCFAVKVLRGFASRSRLANSYVVVFTASAIIASTANKALADEGGVSFWIPGFYGSLAATPQQPGFSFATIYYHSSVAADGSVAFARQVTRGKFTTNFNANLNAHIDAKADLAMATPGYTLATPILGGQANVTLLAPYGRSEGKVDAILQTSLGPLGFTRSGALDQGITGIGDMAPQFSLRWNEGVHNVMTYIIGNLTTGRYDPTRLANLGLGHNAIDAGGAYTYFNPQTGNEFSGTVGATYNYDDKHTQYQNGVDVHFDWGASKFLTKQFQIGLVGYLNNQASCDSGTGDRVGCFQSRVAGIGPQIGYIIPISKEWQGYINLKGYREFDASHRADGWNTWLTFAISPAALTERPHSSRPMTTK